MKSQFVALSILGFATVSLLLNQGVVGQVAAGPTRVAYVSAQRVLIESAPGKAEMARLQSAQQQRAVDLRAKQAALESTRGLIAKGGDAGALAKLQQQEQQQRLELERSTLQVQNELQVLQRQMMTDLQTKVRPVVESVAREQSVDLVLSSDSTVVWAVPGLDLTAVVIERLSSQ